MNLLVDIGNSRLKWGVEQSGSVDYCGKPIDYRETDVCHELRHIWLELGTPRSMAVASVASAQMVAELSQLALNLWPALDIIVPRAAARAFGVSNAYRQPEKLGIDRWMAILAAHRDYPGHCCVVDCGTAITVDLIDANGLHLGGMISPGLRSMKKALTANTAALVFDPSPHAVGLADNMVAAIDSGTLLAAVGLIETVLRRQDKSFRLVLTGGDAETISRQLQVPSVIDADLVLKGLSLYCHTDEAA